MIIFFYIISILYQIQVSVCGHFLFTISTRFLPVMFSIIFDATVVDIGFWYQRYYQNLRLLWSQVLSCINVFQFVNCQTILNVSAKRGNK